MNNLGQLAFDPTDVQQNKVLGGTAPASTVVSVNTLAHAVETRINQSGAQFAALTVDDLGRIYAGDGVSGEVRLFDSLGSFIAVVAYVLRDTGSAQISGLARDPGGHIYVAQKDPNRLAVFDAAQQFVGFLTSPTFNAPVSVFFNPEDDLLYVGNDNHGVLTVLTPAGAARGSSHLGGRGIGTPAAVITGMLSTDQEVTNVDVHPVHARERSGLGELLYRGSATSTNPVRPARRAGHPRRPSRALSASRSRRFHHARVTALRPRRRRTPPDSGRWVPTRPATAANTRHAPTGRTSRGIVANRRPGLQDVIRRALTERPLPAGRGSDWPLFVCSGRVR